MLVQDVVELLVTEHGYTLGASRPNKPNGNGHANSDSFDDLLVADPAGRLGLSGRQDSQGRRPAREHRQPVGKDDHQRHEWRCCS